MMILLLCCLLTNFNCFLQCHRAVVTTVISFAVLLVRVLIVSKNASFENPISNNNTDIVPTSTFRLMIQNDFGKNHAANNRNSLYVAKACFLNNFNPVNKDLLPKDLKSLNQQHDDVDTIPRLLVPSKSSTSFIYQHSLYAFHTEILHALNRNKTLWSCICSSYIPHDLLLLPSSPPSCYNLRFSDRKRYGPTFFYVLKRGHKF